MRPRTHILGRATRPSRLSLKRRRAAHRALHEEPSLMKRFFRRVAFYLVAIWASITLDFLIPRLAPGDPAEALLVRLERSGPVSPSALKAFRAAFGVDTQDPLWLQYVHYLGNL